jgi:hypothetical protein
MYGTQMYTRTHAHAHTHDLSSCQASYVLVPLVRKLLPSDRKRNKYSTAAMSLSYVLYKIYLSKSSIFSKISYHTSFHEHKLSDANITSNSQVRLFALLILLIVGNWVIYHAVRISPNIIPRFLKISQLVQKLNKWDTQTNTHRHREWWSHKANSLPKHGK